jgi:hypothetical protein
MTGRSTKAPNKTKKAMQMNPSELINSYLEDIRTRADGHAEAHANCLRIDRIIGYPITILSAFLASTMMINDDGNDYIKILKLIFSILLFIVSLSRDYFNPSQQSHDHDISSKLYVHLQRSVEVRLIKNSISLSEKRDICKDIVDQISIIEQYELPIPHKIMKKINSHKKIPKSIIINKVFLEHSLNTKSNFSSDRSIDTSLSIITESCLTPRTPQTPQTPITPRTPITQRTTKNPSPFTFQTSLPRQIKHKEYILYIPKSQKLLKSPKIFPINCNI